MVVSTDAKWGEGNDGNPNFLSRQEVCSSRSMALHGNQLAFNVCRKALDIRIMETEAKFFSQCDHDIPPLNEPRLI